MKELMSVLFGGDLFLGNGSEAVRGDGGAAANDNFMGRG